MNLDLGGSELVTFRKKEKEGSEVVMHWLMVDLPEVQLLD